MCWCCHSTFRWIFSRYWLSLKFSSFIPVNWNVFFNCHAVSHHFIFNPLSERCERKTKALYFEFPLHFLGQILHESVCLLELNFISVEKICIQTRCFHQFLPLKFQIYWKLFRAFLSIFQVADWLRVVWGVFW